MIYATCHPERQHRGKGLCGACYQRRRRATDESARLAHRRSSRNWEKNHPEQRRAMVRRFRYGITAEQFSELLDAQKSRCAICNSKCKLMLDHNHDTMVVRGLLCNSCNLALGLYEKLMKKGDVAVYLTRQTNFKASANRQNGKSWKF